MADKFYAVTDIRHGARVEDGSAEGKYVRTTFKAGDEVKGLSKEDMKGLWDAGALRREVAEDKKDEDEDEGSQKPAPAKVAPAKATAATAKQGGQA